MLRRNRFVLVVALRDDLGNGAAEASVADFDRRLAQAVIAQIHQAMLAPIVHIVHVGAETSVAKVIQRSKGSNADIVRGSVAPVAEVMGESASIAPVAHVGGSTHASAAGILIVEESAAVASVAGVRAAEGATVASVAGVGGSKHAAVTQVLVRFLTNTEVFRGQLSVRSKQGPIKGHQIVGGTIHGGPRAQRRPPARDGSVVGKIVHPGVGSLHAWPCGSLEGNPPAFRHQRLDGLYLEGFSGGCKGGAVEEGPGAR